MLKKNHLNIVGIFCYLALSNCQDSDVIYPKPTPSTIKKTADIPQVNTPLPEMTSDHPASQQNKWQDMGAIPGTHFFKSAAGVVIGKEILVGTADGVWRRPLDKSAPWMQIGLKDLIVSSLYANDKFIIAGVYHSDGPSVYRSINGGSSWTQVGEGLAGGTPSDPTYAGVHQIIAHPANNKTLYMNMQGTSIACSEDAGVNWSYVKGAADLAEMTGGDCFLHILPGVPGKLFQGCEAPLDEAWIGHYDIPEGGCAKLKQAVKHIGYQQITNKRINALASFVQHPGWLYAGLEGGLMRFDASSLQDPPNWEMLWIGGTQQYPYTYIRSVWIDPKEKEHIVFGGIINQPQTSFPLYETFDGGKTIDYPIEPPQFNASGQGILFDVKFGQDDCNLALGANVQDSQGEMNAHVFLLNACQKSQDS